MSCHLLQDRPLVWVLEPLGKSDDKAEKARVAADRKKKKAKSPKKGRPVAAPGKGTANAKRKPDTEQTKKAAQAMQIVERAKADKNRSLVTPSCS